MSVPSSEERVPEAKFGFLFDGSLITPTDTPPAIDLEELKQLGLEIVENPTVFESVQTLANEPLPKNVTAIVVSDPTRGFVDDDIEQGGYPKILQFLASKHGLGDDVCPAWIDYDVTENTEK